MYKSWTDEATGLDLVAYTEVDQDADYSWLEGEAENGEEYIANPKTGEPPSYPSAQARLDAFYEGEWHFVGVCVAVYDPDDDSAESAIIGRGSIWGVESDSGNYLNECVNLYGLDQEAIEEALGVLEQRKRAEDVLWAEG